ncbi:hypothetical protein L7A47_35205, partial [Achromobacter xylosoxidans]|uniref:hypothetical protein n=1 Tax=Alcaligenes xylosoxydans xylosoxydans TaxID=85698 RepID=UPI001F0DE531
TMTVQVRIVSTLKTDLKFALTISVAIRNNFCGKKESHVEDFDCGCFGTELGGLRIRQRARQLANVWRD